MTTPRGKARGELKGALARLGTAWKEVGAPQSGALRPGLSPDAVRAALRPWSSTPPPELIELYEWADGMDSELELFPGGCFLSSGEALESRRVMLDTAAKVAAATGVNPAVVWDKKWLPLFSGEGGFYVVVPPSRSQSLSPIWLKDREEPEATLAFDSLTALIATTGECFETGAYSFLAGDSLTIENPTASGEAFRRHNPRAAGLPAAGVEESAVVARLIDALAHGDGRAKGEAAATLMKRKDRSAVPDLIRLLANSNGVVRGLSARVLEKIKDVRAVPALIAGLKDPELNVRNYAAMALAAIGDRQAIGPLIEALRASRPEQIGGIAVALGALNAISAIDHLLPLLQTQSFPVRVHVVRVLGMFSDSRIPGILSPLLADTEVQVRAAAASGLGHRRYASAVMPLLACLDDSSWQVRIAALGALQSVGDPSAIDPITRIVETMEPTADPLTLGYQQAFRASAKRAIEVLSKKRRS